MGDKPLSDQVDKTSLEHKGLRKTAWKGWLVLAMILVLPVLSVSQALQQNMTLIVNGRSGLAPVVEINGRAYIELESLAHVANGSLDYKGNQIILTVPGSGTKAGTIPSAASEPANQGFSKQFLRAGIEEIAAIREWRSMLANAVEHGYPVGEDWVSGYQGQAAKSLNLVSVAVSTDSDRDALKLFTNAFVMMQNLSNTILDLRKSMDYISPDALTSDPSDQKILNCAHSLATTVAGGQFQDVVACH